MKRITITLIALVVLTTTAYPQTVQKTAREVDDAIEVVDGRKVKHLQLMKQRDDAGMDNTTGMSASVSKSAVANSEIFIFEMISNGSGPITGQTGFDVTTPTGVGAYSADWLRDVLESSNVPPTIQQLPGGMQDAGGWYSVVAGGGEPNFESALGRWSRNGQYLSAVDGSIYEIRFTAAGGKAEMRFTTGTVVDVPFELWYLADTPDDPSDDFRVPARIFDDNFNDVFDFKLDQIADEDDDDPASDWIYFLMPFWDLSPGQSGYDEWALDPSETKFSAFCGICDRFNLPLSRIVLMNWDRHQGETVPGAGDGPVEALPETGTTFRMTGGDLDLRPTCSAAIFDDSSPGSFGVTAYDGSGLAAINVLSTTNATVVVPAFSPGERSVTVTVTRSGTSSDFSAALEIADPNGNVISCERGFRGWSVHEAGNIALALQTNSSLGAEGNALIPSQGLNAFWPRDAAAVDHLFSGSLWAGAVVDGEKRVMDANYGFGEWTQTPGSDNTNAPGLSDQDIGATYDDQSAGSVSIGLQVHQRSFQWSNPTRDDFILFTYTLENTGLSGDLSDVFAALWLDPDIVAWYNDNAGFDADRGLIYQFDDPNEGGGYVGIKVVGGAPHSAAGYGWQSGSSLCIDDFFDEDKYDCMTAVFPPLDLDPDDFRIMITAQPFDLAVGETHTVAIGLVMGEDLAALQANADVMDTVLDVPGLIQLVASLDGGPGNSLLAKLEAAQKSLDKGNTNAAAGQLQAFINEVQAQSGKSITDTEASLLIFVAQTILDNIASGAFAKSGQGVSDDGIPASYQLLANYPNPFNPTTTISFDLPEAGYVEMGVFDVMGHQVGTLVQDARPAGRHTVAWQAGDLPSGVYFYRMTAGDFVQVNQMLLIK